MALTDLAVKANTHKYSNGEIKTPPYKLSDSGGLQLHITTNGSKLWRMAYRFDGKQKTLSFGAYPTVSLLDAREERDKAKKLLVKGQDPSNVAKAKKANKLEQKANTFKVWAEKWLEHWQADKSPRHVGYTQRRIEADIYPAIGHMPIADIEAPHIADVMRKIAERGALDIAKRSYEIIGQVFRYAIANDKSGTVKRNPAADIKPSDIIKPRQKQNYARVDIQEFPALLRAIDNSEARAVTRIAIKLMALTFVRTSELIQAKWSEFDLDAKVWRIPAERMKKRTLHIVPLAKQTIELLNTLHPITGKTDYLFHNQNDYTKPMSNNTILKALERMGYKGEMTGHGFRGVAKTQLTEMGYPDEHTELQLAHLVGNETKRAYDHAKHIPARTAMMQAWADYLDELKAGAKVIPFKAA